MANYIQDPNDSKKQIPGPPPDKYYDRSLVPQTGSLLKTPNHIYITTAITNDVGFFFGSSASFAAVSNKSLAANYQSFGAVPAGTKLDIHPCAWSGSSVDNDAGNVIFVYKGGLDGSGRP